ncbi:MAG: heme exporter protein CcmD [Hyphomicrobiaceae bacterium]|nr:heme exporter protein CcmD [Hyphomicrobiaceae bacterium]
MFGPHSGYILIAWLAVIVLIAAVGLWLFIDRRKLTRQLAELEAREARRKSGSTAP